MTKEEAIKLRRTIIILIVIGILIIFLDKAFRDGSMLSSKIYFSIAGPFCFLSIYAKTKDL